MSSVRFPSLTPRSGVSSSGRSPDYEPSPSNAANRLRVDITLADSNSLRPSPPSSHSSHPPVQSHSQPASIPHSPPAVSSPASNASFFPTAIAPTPGRKLSHPRSARGSLPNPVLAAKKKTALPLALQLSRERELELQEQNQANARGRGKGRKSTVNSQGMHLSAGSVSSAGFLSARGPAKSFVPLRELGISLDDSATIQMNTGTGSSGSGSGSASASAYYSVIQAAARAVVESVDELDADDETELQHTYQRQGLTIGEIAEKVNEFEASKQAFNRVNEAVAALRNVDRSSVVNEISQYFQQMKREEKLESRRLEMLEFSQLEAQQAIQATKSALEAEIQQKHESTAKVLTKYYLHLKSAMREVSQQMNQSPGKGATAARKFSTSTAIRPSPASEAAQYREENPFRLDDIEGLNETEAGNMLKLEIQIGILEAKLADQEGRLAKGEKPAEGGEASDAPAPELSFEQKAARLLNLIKTLQNSRVVLDRRVDQLTLERQQLIEKVNSYELMQARLDKLIAEKEAKEREMARVQENRLSLEESKFIEDQQKIDELERRNDSLVKKWNQSQSSITEMKSELERLKEQDAEREYKSKSELIRLRIIIQDLMMGRNKEREKRMQLIEEIKDLKKMVDNERNGEGKDGQEKSSIGEWSDRILEALNSAEEIEDKEENEQLTMMANDAIAGSGSEEREIQEIGMNRVLMANKEKEKEKENQLTQKDNTNGNNRAEDAKSRGSLTPVKKGSELAGSSNSAYSSVSKQYNEFKLRQSLLTAQKQLKERNSWLKEKFGCQFDRFGNLVSEGKLAPLLRNESSNAADQAAEAVAAFVKSPKFKGTVPMKDDAAGAASGSASSSALSQLTLQFEIRLKKVAHKLKSALTQLSVKQNEVQKMGEMIGKLRQENRHSENVKLKLGIRVETLQSQLTKLLKATMNILKKSYSRNGAAAAQQQQNSVAALAEIISEIPMRQPAFRAGGGSSNVGLFSQMGFLGNRAQQQKGPSRSKSASGANTASGTPQTKTPENEREDGQSQGSDLAALLDRASLVVEKVEERLKHKQKIRHDVEKQKIARSDDEEEPKQNEKHRETEREESKPGKPPVAPAKKAERKTVEAKSSAASGHSDRAVVVDSADADSGSDEPAADESEAAESYERVPMPIASAAAQLLLSTPSADSSTPTSLESAAFDFLNSLNDTAAVLAETAVEFESEDRAEAQHDIEAKAEQVLDFHTIVRSRAGTPADGSRPVEFDGAAAEREADEILTLPLESIMQQPVQQSELDAIAHSQHQAHAHAHAARSRPSSSRPHSRAADAVASIAISSAAHFSQRPPSAKARAHHHQAQPQPHAAESQLQKDSAHGHRPASQELHHHAESSRSGAASRERQPVVISSHQSAVDSHLVAQQLTHKWPLEARGHSPRAFDIRREFDVNEKAEEKSELSTRKEAKSKAPRSRSQSQSPPRLSSSFPLPKAAPAEPTLKDIQEASKRPEPSARSSAASHHHAQPASESNRRPSMVDVAASHVQSLTYELSRAMEENEELRRALSHRTAHPAALPHPPHHAPASQESAEFDSVPSSIAPPDRSLLAGKPYSAQRVIASKYRANMDYYSMKLSEQSNLLSDTRHHLEKQRQLNFIMAQFIQRIVKQREKWVRKADKRFSAVGIERSMAMATSNSIKEREVTKQREIQTTQKSVVVQFKPLQQQGNTAEQSANATDENKPAVAAASQPTAESSVPQPAAVSSAQEPSIAASVAADDELDADSDSESEGDNPLSALLASEDARILDYVDSVTRSSALAESPLINDPWYRQSSEQLYYTKPVFSYSYGLNPNDLAVEHDQLSSRARSRSRSPRRLTEPFDAQDSRWRGAEWIKFDSAAASGRSISPPRVRGYSISSSASSTRLPELPIDNSVSMSAGPSGALLRSIAPGFNPAKLPTDAIYSTFKPKSFHSKQFVSPGNGSVFLGYTNEALPPNQNTGARPLRVQGNKVGDKSPTRKQKYQTQEAEEEKAAESQPPNAESGADVESEQLNQGHQIAEDEKEDANAAEEAKQIGSGEDDGRAEKSVTFADTTEVQVLERPQSEPSEPQSTVPHPPASAPMSSTMDAFKLNYFDHSQTVIINPAASKSQGLASKRKVRGSSAKIGAAPGVPRNFVSVLTVKPTGVQKDRKRADGQFSGTSSSIIEAMLDES